MQTLRYDRRFRADHMIFVNSVSLSLTLAALLVHTAKWNNKKAAKKMFTRYSMRREQAAAAAKNVNNVQTHGHHSRHTKSNFSTALMTFWANLMLPRTSLCVDVTDALGANFGFSPDLASMARETASSQVKCEHFLIFDLIHCEALFDMS